VAAKITLFDDVFVKHSALVFRNSPDLPHCLNKYVKRDYSFSAAVP